MSLDGGIIMWIILVIIAVIAFLAFCGFVFEKRDKGKASTQLDELKSKHNVTLSFVSQAGCMAFCDGEQKLYKYVNVLSRMDEIPYDSIIKCEKNPHINGVSFWALTPTYTEYVSGDVGVDMLSALREKMNAIIAVNKKQIEREYATIATIPSNAARVTVKGYNGYSSSIPSTIKGITSAFMWESADTLYMLSTFDMLDFKLRPGIYKLISIKKSNIVSVSQEGDVHYTTEVHGGGGGGSSIKGAIIGGVIAGDAGAIIGSRKSTDPITSSTKQIDDRTTNVKILDANNNFCEILFGHNDYYAISKFAGK